MRKLWLLLPVLLLGPVAVAAPGITLIVADRFEFTDCSSSGSTSQSVKAGTYLLRVTDNDTFLCYAATCTGTTGEKFPSGTVMLLRFETTTTVSCRSAASTGDAILTRGG